MHCSVSVRVPIWFSLIRIALATPSSMPRSRRSMLVQKRSSPTSCTRVESASVSFAHPDQSSSASPDRKSTRLNSSHLVISYAVFCLKKKKQGLLHDLDSYGTEPRPAELSHPALFCDHPRV